MRSSLLGLLTVFMTAMLAGEPAHAVPVSGALVPQPTGSADTYLQVSAGAVHTLALRNDGTIAAWGDNVHGQCDVPALPVGLTYVEVAAGGYMGIDWNGGAEWTTGVSVARVSDGTIVQWGFVTDSVPALPFGLSYVEVAAGSAHILARRSDGSVVAWGSNDDGQCDVPVLPLGLTFSEISAGGSQWTLIDDTWAHPNFWGGPSGHSVARLSDGSIVQWGSATGSVPALPSGLGYVEVSTGGKHTVARRSDGSVVQWGRVSARVPVLASGLSYVSLDAGAVHTVAHVSDGTLRAWGENEFGQCNIPAPPSGLDFVEVSAGGCSSYISAIIGQWWLPYLPLAAHSVARLSDGSLVAWGDNTYGQCNVAAGALGTNHCLGIPNSSGEAARISAIGSESLAANDLVLNAVSLPDTPFLFFSGLGQNQAVFGDGYLCVSGNLVRIGIGGTASGGVASSMVDLPSSGITVPGTRYFQCLFRDPAAGSTGFNLSDSLKVTFTP
jgi:Regulator of chromosome condensation (RCC1) repeat